MQHPWVQPLKSELEITALDLLKKVLCMRDNEPVPIATLQLERGGIFLRRF